MRDDEKSKPEEVAKRTAIGGKRCTELAEHGLGAVQVRVILEPVPVPPLYGKAMRIVKSLTEFSAARQE